MVTVTEEEEEVTGIVTEEEVVAMDTATVPHR